MSWASARASVRSSSRAKRGGHGAGDLSDFDGMGQAVAEMVAKAGREDLGFGFQAAESAGMDDAVAVALEGVAVRMGGFRIAPPSALCHRKAEMAEHGVPGLLCGRSPYA